MSISIHHWVSEEAAWNVDVVVVIETSHDDELEKLKPKMAKLAKPTADASPDWALPGFRQNLGSILQRDPRVQVVKTLKTIINDPTSQPINLSRGAMEIYHNKNVYAEYFPFFFHLWSMCILS